MQIIERSIGGKQHVAPVVSHPVLLEPEMLAGRGNELPHARCLGMGKGLRVKCAFDDRQQRHFGWHAAFFDFLDDVMQVFGAAINKALDVIGAGGVPLLLLQNEWRIKFFHHEAATHPLPQIGVVKLPGGAWIGGILHVQLCGHIGIGAGRG